MSLKSNIYTLQFKLRQVILGYYCAATHVDTSFIGNNFTPERILFVLAGLIGDSVMSIPAISTARRIWPNAHIAVVGKTHNRDLLLGSPEIDEFHVCEADPLSIRRSKEIKELASWIEQQQFDASIILLGDQYAHLLAQAKIPVRVGVDGTLMERCLTHTYKIGSPRTWGADERLNSIRIFRSGIDKTLPKLSGDRKEARATRKKLSEFGLHENERYIALHPFGSSPRQWFDLEKIVPLADSVYDSSGVRTVLIGGNETLSRLDLGSRIVDTRGRLSLRELLAVISESDCVITTDSGPFHIAGALGKRIIGLFRDRRPEHAYAYPTSEVVFGYDDMCANECEWDRCAETRCRQMAAIDVSSVIDAVKAATK